MGEEIAKQVSVLALSSRFDGRMACLSPSAARLVSVLALSSRFDGRGKMNIFGYNMDVSVLALSSRFDGHLSRRTSFGEQVRFQYSLCRVVLMVIISPF